MSIKIFVSVMVLGIVLSQATTEPVANTAVEENVTTAVIDETPLQEAVADKTPQQYPAPLFMASTCGDTGITCPDGSCCADVKTTAAGVSATVTSCILNSQAGTTATVGTSSVEYGTCQNAVNLVLGFATFLLAFLSF